MDPELQLLVLTHACSSPFFSTAITRGRPAVQAFTAALPAVSLANTPSWDAAAEEGMQGDVPLAGAAIGGGWQCKGQLRIQAASSPSPPSTGAIGVALAPVPSYRSHLHLLLSPLLQAPEVEAVAEIRSRTAVHVLLSPLLLAPEAEAEKRSISIRLSPPRPPRPPRPPSRSRRRLGLRLPP